MHRDPETGQFLAHDDADEPLDLTYADHEFLNFRLFNQESDSQDDQDFVEFRIEDDVLDLENDELGMLSWMTGRLTIAADFNPNNEDAGRVQAEAEIGSNLAGTEYLSEQQIGGVQAVSSSDGSVGAGAANDEAGLWAHLTATANPAFFAASADGASGGGTNGDDRLVREYYSETGEGPYIDSTDDITVRITVEKERSDDQVFAVCVGQMSFVVFEYETRRAEFAPYDPGPSV